MKPILAFIGWTLVCLSIGFVVGRATANQKNQQELHAVGVDCYDKDGNLVHSEDDKYGVAIACAPGQFARLKQPNPPEHINVH